MKTKLPVWMLPSEGRKKIVAFLYVYEDGRVEIEPKGREGKEYARLIREKRQRMGWPVDKASPSEMKSIYSLAAGFSVGSRLRGGVMFSALEIFQY